MTVPVTTTLPVRLITELDFMCIVPSALKWIKVLSAGEQDFKTVDGLETTVAVLLFTDARAAPEEVSNVSLRLGKKVVECLLNIPLSRVYQYRISRY